MAATNKCLERSNKSRAGFRRQIKRPAAQLIPLALPTGGSPCCGISALPDFHPPFGARKLNMSWHHPGLYFLLCLLTGLVTFLAIIYECIQKFRRTPLVVLP